MRFALLIAVFLLHFTAPAQAGVAGMYGMWDTYAVARDKAPRVKPHHRYVVKTSAHRRGTMRFNRPSITGPTRRLFTAHNDALSRVGCLSPEMRRVWALTIAHWGPLRIVSTCRPGAMIRGTHRRSQHASGRAVDFMPPRGQKAAMVRWLHINTPGGVMTYSNFSHIHLDVGPRFLALNRRG